jgi:endonuclease YncB( thermonuclease family)
LSVASQSTATAIAGVPSDRFASDTDLDGWLVRGGYAVAYRRYSWSYAPAESMAWLEGVGLWRGDFEHADDWRRSHRR